jgi:hypothetical protein
MAKKRLLDTHAPWVGRSGVTLIANERNDQIKRWSVEHDDDHDDRSLSFAAVCYAAPVPLLYVKNDHPEHTVYADPWPESWNEAYDKRPRFSGGSRRGVLIPAEQVPIPRRLRQLQKAGALIAAEMDRLIRRLEAGEDGDDR